MYSAPAISLRHVSKRYQIFPTPQHRLKQFLLGHYRNYYREFWALRDVSMDISHGEVIGIIGRNGAGKSTLLQLVCGTLTPTEGSVQVNGRIAALLELGAGFNPDFSGRENVYLNAAILGLSQAEIDQRFDAIVAFSGIGNFIDQPVKTYSSGMYIRLAFSVAINVDPDILIVDEALSVGDGIFSRKSFDRIMALKEAGKTILFCSHSMYQIESICNRAIWLEGGTVREVGLPAPVVSRYEVFLAANADGGLGTAEAPKVQAAAGPAALEDSANILPRLLDCTMRADGVEGREVALRSRISTLELALRFRAPAHLPTPTVAYSITALDGRVVTSLGTHNDQFPLQRHANGECSVQVRFAAIPLLKGEYCVSAFLLCERGLHLYDQALEFGKLIVSQADLEQGLVSIAHQWAQEPQPVAETV